MAKIKDVIITSTGLSELAKVNAGQAKLTYTKAVLSSQDLTALTVEQVKATTSLSVLKETGLALLSQRDLSVVVSASFSNQGLTTDLSFNAVGWYAKTDTDSEFLLAISRCDGIQVIGTPDPTGADTQSITLQLGLGFSQDNQVTVVQDPAGVAKTSDLTTAIEQMNQQLATYQSNTTNAINLKANTSDMATELADLQGKVATKANADDVYNKQEVDSKVANAGQVKTVNGLTPDSSGNIALTIQQVDLAPYAKTVDVNNQVSTLQTNINAKADQSDVNTKYNDAVSKANTAQSTADNANNNANGRLALSGGTMNKASKISWQGNTAVPSVDGDLGGLYWNGARDWIHLFGDNYSADNLDLAIDLGDDNSNKISMRWCGQEKATITSDGKFNGLVDWGSLQNNPINIAGNIYNKINWSNYWYDIFLNYSSPQPRLVSIRDESQAGHMLGNYSAGIGFGGEDTHGVLDVAYSNHQARIIGGNGNSPVWHEDIAWQSNISDLQNQLNQLKSNQFETQTFTDETSAKNWEAQRPGMRLAIINS